MRRYLVVAHRTLGGEELTAHLHQLRVEDPYCRFHVLVPEYRPSEHMWQDGEIRAAAEARLESTLTSMAEMGMGATGEVGDANPVYAIGDVLRREGRDAFCGIVLSTLPKKRSAWLLLGMPRRIEREYSWLPMTHIVTQDVLVG